MLVSDAAAASVFVKVISKITRNTLCLSEQKEKKSKLADIEILSLIHIKLDFLPLAPKSCQRAFSEFQIFLEIVAVLFVCGYNVQISAIYIFKYVVAFQHLAFEQNEEKTHYS